MNTIQPSQTFKEIPSPLKCSLMLSTAYSLKIGSDCEAEGEMGIIGIDLAVVVRKDDPDG